MLIPFQSKGRGGEETERRGEGGWMERERKEV